MFHPARWLPLGFALLPAAAWAGPWARPAGSTYAKLGWGHFDGRAAFDPAAGGPFRGEAFEAYGEIGLGGGVELDASGRWVSHHVGDAVSTGVQDLELIAEWAPISTDRALALTGGLRVGPYRRGLQPELGPGGADVLVGLGWGESFGPGWLALDSQLRHRLGIPSSGLRLRAELGVLGDLPVGGALTAEVQPAFGRSDDITAPVAPVPRVLALGGKTFVALVGGLGLTADAAWLPPLLNDGPGVRAGAGVTWER